MIKAKSSQAKQDELQPPGPLLGHEHTAIEAVNPLKEAATRESRGKSRDRIFRTLHLGHVEYLTAQAYATAVIAMQCAKEAGGTDDEAMLGTARRLRCTTFLGRFGLGEDGHQSEHEMLVVQWQEGLKRVVWPRSKAEDPIL